MQKVQWQAIAKILCLGFSQVGYFPVYIAPPFLICAFGLNDGKSLDKDTFKQALQDFSSLDNEEYLDLLSTHDVKVQVTCDNIERVVIELAHKFMIQNPSYVIDCWKDILPQFFSNHHVDVEAVLLDMEPSAAKVIKRLSFPNNMSLCQKTVSEHLKKFKKLASKDLLGAFLRFCTGADILLRHHCDV